MDELPDFRNIRDEWSQLLDQKLEARNTIVNNDLFATIEYLSFCDRFSKWLLLNARELDRVKLSDSRSDKVAALELNDLKANIDKKYQSLQDEYSVLAETTLRRCEDTVTRYADGNKFDIKSDLNHNLDKQLFLQELKDSLEDYRIAREEYITALDIPYKRALIDKEIPEDIGEESPEIDGILSQLDTIITSCDYAMIISDVEE